MGLSKRVSKDTRELVESLREAAAPAIDDVIFNLFGIRPETKEEPNLLDRGGDDLILDDISRMLKGEEALNIPLTRDMRSKSAGLVSRLQDALKLGQMTRDEVGRDWEALKEEAERRKAELRKEIKKQRVLGTTKAKAKEKELQSELDEIQSALKAGASGKKQPVSQTTREARLDAKYFDESFSPLRSISGTTNDWDWERSAKTGSNGKRGGFGSVLFEGDVVVKRGDVGEKELDIIRKAGELGLGPKLLYGEVGPRKETFGGVQVHTGRIAMSRVEGVELSSLAGQTLKGKVPGDIYWGARARIHRAGIAHNDAHGRNVIVDDQGRPRFVDFGLSQDNVKAALSEALGGIVSRSVLPPGAVIQGTLKSDFQAVRDTSSGLGKPVGEQPKNLRTLYANLSKVKIELKRMGLSNDDIAQLMATGIRNPESTYNKGPWGKLTNEQTLQIINTLYDGI